MGERIEYSWSGQSDIWQGLLFVDNELIAYGVGNTLLACQADLLVNAELLDIASML